MILRPLFVAVAFCLLPAAFAKATLAETVLTPETAPALEPLRIAALSDAMMMGQVMEVMREEGLEYGRTLEQEMFSGRGGERWQATVEQIYDPELMREQFDTALAVELAGADDVLRQIEIFIGSEQGQRYLKLEIDARRALLDTTVEEAAKVTWADMEGEDTPRAALIRDFAASNDLIESNVMGALNANLAFYRGLAETGSFPEKMTEDQMLQDVWSQEPQIRTETENWLYPFLALAYQPLSDSDLETYTAFSESRAGKRLNAALFAAYDFVFIRISEDLGKAAALQMQGEDI